ncbi:prolyl oligopeptidase [Multifurca ochricompacta]|uniref:Prolyl endopeptidase n=1 Tax=Multifurca ochricompacta TaxID=376703 RepID=A0AAD4LY97_9AGAM|nr:prolyl oligopeptidase [Multifurca ochricompacta]
MLIPALLRFRRLSLLFSRPRDSSCSLLISYQDQLPFAISLRNMTASSWTPHSYPPTRRSDHVDVYHSEANGEVNVPDPYSWLEKDGEEKEKWLAAQEALARSFLDAHPDRVRLEEEIKASTDYEKFGLPSLKDDGRWYWSYNSGLQAQPVYYRSRDSELPDSVSGPGGEVFFDPNVLSSDGSVSLSSGSYSRDGKWFAYALSHSGSDFTNIYIRSTDHPLTDADNDLRLSDELEFRFPDRSSHNPAGSNKADIQTGSDSDKDAQLFYHRVRTNQSEDVLVVKNPDQPEWLWGAAISEVDGRWLELSVSRDTSRKNLLWLADLEKEQIGPNLNWIKLVNDFEAEYNIIGNDGSKFYLQTNAGAPRYKVITVDVEGFRLASQSGLVHIKDFSKDLIAEDKDAHLEDISILGHDRLVTIYKRNVMDELYIHDLKSGKQLKRLASDHVGALTAYGRRTQQFFFVWLTGFDTPGIAARYDFSEPSGGKVDGRWNVWRETKVGGLAGGGGFIAEQIWYTSRDGTKIPMFVVRHKDTPLDGTAPAIQYGYGGFSISIGPFFSPSILTAMRAYGFVLAVPNIRGGGEFGEDWHLAGTRERKINCFDDFTAATEWLVENKYASRGRIAINGGSNGGLLVSACVNRAPEGLFGAAIAEVGVHDLLKFADFTIGRAWTSDYGNPHDSHDFDFIYPISRYTTCQPIKSFHQRYFSLLIVHDDRVVPMHSFKLAATLQHVASGNPHPLLLRLELKAGHGAGKSTELKIKEAADKWSFAAQTMGLKWQRNVTEKTKM